MLWPMVEMMPKFSIMCVLDTCPLVGLLLLTVIQIVAASPYTPPVYEYDDAVPVGNYRAFVRLAGCGGSGGGAAEFACLQAADTLVLQNASGTVSTTRGYFGSFAFQPVVDGSYIQMRPSQQLLLGQVNGKRILVGVSIPSSLLLFTHTRRPANSD
jgi:hypothetical protein